jgi:hypothetical protein
MLIRQKLSFITGNPLIMRQYVSVGYGTLLQLVTAVLGLARNVADGLQVHSLCKVQSCSVEHP